MKGVKDVDVESLTCYEDMKKAYEELQRQENDIESELEEILNQQEPLSAQMGAIPKLTSVIDNLMIDGKNLKNVILKTTSLAEKVSVKVRLLDTAKCCVQNAIKRVDDILDLKSCVEGVKGAFKQEEFEQAAAFIHRYLSLDERALREILPEDTEETDLNASFVYLHEAKATLQNDVRNRFEEAVVCKDKQQVERFFKLFPLVGLEEEGLLKFSKYLRTQISESSELHLDSALHIGHKERRSGVIFADTLSKLFEGIARIVEDHQPLVDTFYGPGKMLAVQIELQNECDIQVKYIVDNFFKVRRFQEMCDNLGKVNDKQKSLDSKDKVDPKELDMLLGEIVLLSAHTSLYQAFLKMKVQSDLAALASDDKLKERHDVYSNSGLCRLMETLMSDYIVMEGYFMRKMMKKAMTMDASESDNISSSVVDDVFFVLQKSLRRAISARNTNIICAVLNNSSSILTTEYVEFFKTRMKLTGFPSNSIDLSGMFQGKSQSTITDVFTAKRDFLIVLNNIDVSCEYLTKLLSELTKECSQKINQDDDDTIKLQSCLSDLGACSQQFKDILQSGISQLCTNTLLVKINPLVDAFTSVKHVLMEEDFLYYEVNDPFVQNLIAAIDNKLSTLKELLTSPNYSSIVGMLCQEVATRMEKVVIKCMFNRLGGLKLDKDLRSLIQYLTNVSEWTVRDKFARLTQIATVLNLEKVNELLEYWGENSGPMTWRLTPGEVRTVLSLRNEFRNEDIQRLKL